MSDVDVDDCDDDAGSLDRRRDFEAKRRFSCATSVGVKLSRTGCAVPFIVIT